MFARTKLPGMIPINVPRKNWLNLILVKPIAKFNPLNGNNGIKRRKSITKKPFSFIFVSYLSSFFNLFFRSLSMKFFPKNLEIKKAIEDPNVAAMTV